MKIDSHILFLIVIIGVISAGIVGATVMNSDTSMKQEVFDGITVSVPVDSEFVKVDDGVYKDAKYGITINTFKNNDSMIDFLKNSKKSKIIPLENQPPQSIAFKQGNTINLLVTNGVEGMSVSCKDGELTSKVANSIIFSNNQKSQKSGGLSVGGLSIVKPQMEFKKDYNLTMILLADVDTTNFNVAMFQNNTISVVDEYNSEISQEQNNFPIFINNNEADDGGSASDVVDDNNDNVTKVVSGDDSGNSNSGSGNELVDAFSDTVENIPAQNNPASSSSADNSHSQPSTSSNSPSTSSSSSSNSNPSAPASSSSSNNQPTNNQPQKLTVNECKNALSASLPSGYSFDTRSDDLGSSYKLYILDDKNKDAGYIVVDAKTGNLLENHIK